MASCGDDEGESNEGGQTSAEEHPRLRNRYLLGSLETTALAILKSMARADWLSHDSGFSQDDHIGVFSNGDAISDALEKLMPGVKAQADTADIAGAMDLLLGVVGRCFADPHMRTHDLKAHHHVLMYFSTLGWFCMWRAASARPQS